MHRFERTVLRTLPPSSFAFRQKVRFQDVDAAGLLFFGRYFDVIHDAYVSFLEEMGEPLPRVLSSRAWAAPLRHVECDYMAPLFRLETENDQVVAVAQTVHTFIDLSSFERRDVPENITRALTPLATSTLLTT
jgi:1,4-dihydroxy-2-naphthoyl-CoA hydrolase